MVFLVIITTMDLSFWNGDGKIVVCYNQGKEDIKLSPADDCFLIVFREQRQKIEAVCSFGSNPVQL